MAFDLLLGRQSQTASVSVGKDEKHCAQVVALFTDESFSSKFDVVDLRIIWISARGDTCKASSEALTAPSGLEGSVSQLSELDVDRLA